MLWLAVHFPQLSLDLFQAELDALTPDSADQPPPSSPFPAVVLDDNKVCLRNATARAEGIELGCTLATAHSIVSNLKFQHRNPNAESRRLRILAQTLYRFSGHVSVLANDCIALEIGGSLKLFGSHQALASAALEVCAELGHVATQQVAETPKAALALARFKAIAANSEATYTIADVPLAVAGLELCDTHPDLIERFANMGIYTLGPLLQLPSKELGRRFGQKLLTFIAQLTGQLPDPLDPIAPEAHFEQTLHLLQPARNKADLHAHSASPMRRLARELQQWLITNQFGCEQLVWTFASGNTSLSEPDSGPEDTKTRDAKTGDTKTKQEVTHVPVKFAQARQNPADMMRFSELTLEQISLPDEVISIGLRTYRLCAWNNASEPLFALHAHNGQLSDSDTARAQREELVDEFNARFGEGSCLCITSLDQHTPESAWQAHLAIQMHKTQMTRLASDDPASTTQDALTKKRPLWLFDPPRPIPVAELQLLHGPERIQSQWWPTEQSPAATCRDYYIARHQQTGAECWAYVDTSTQWFLHGYFG